MIDFRVPELGEGVYEAEFVRWLVPVGQTVQRAQGLFEVLTDKATMEVPSPFVGKIAEQFAEPGQKIKVGQLVLRYESADALSAATPQPSVGSRESVSAASSRPKQPSTNGPTLPAAVSSAKAAPSVRLLARKLGLDLSHVPGSGPEGRILLQDVLERTSVKPSAVPESKPALPMLGQPGTRLKLQGIRRLSAEHMVLAKRTIPHYSYVDECEVTELVRLRASLKEPFAKLGLKLTYLPFFVKAVCQALQEVPIVNASLDEQAGEVVFHASYHIGIAVATPAGLLVPVLHDADKKSLPELAREIDRLSQDARAGKSRRQDLKGGTFTLTSIGNVGGLISTPVINHPEVGILGLGKIVRRPVYDAADQLRPADLMYLSFSFDHRLVDGASGASFGNAVLAQLRNPAAMLV